MSDIEKITLYNNIRSFLSNELLLALQKELEIDSENLNIRLDGLKKEHEFILLLDYLGSCNHILSFDEGISRLTNSFQPDLLVELKNNEKIFIEVKSTKELYLKKISGGTFQRKIDFAKIFGFPLYFAVKLDQGWGLFPSEFLKKKLHFNHDLIFSCFNEKLDSYGYMIDLLQ